MGSPQPASEGRGTWGGTARRPAPTDLLGNPHEGAFQTGKLNLRRSPPVWGYRPACGPTSCPCPHLRPPPIQVPSVRRGPGLHPPGGPRPRTPHLHSNTFPQRTRAQGTWRALARDLEMPAHQSVDSRGLELGRKATSGAGAANSNAQKGLRERQGVTWANGSREGLGVPALCHV